MSTRWTEDCGVKFVSIGVLWYVKVKSTVVVVGFSTYCSEPLGVDHDRIPGLLEAHSRSTVKGGSEWKDSIAVEEVDGTLRGPDSVNGH